MGKDARLFNCACCHQQTMICSCCDRGNIYCGSECSQSVRKDLARAAGRRYQNTHRGKLKHAARQRRYRQRQKESKATQGKKVTHQGSPTPIANDLLSPELSKPAMDSMTETTPQIRCHFCHSRCSDFVRLGFMQGRTRVQTQNKTSWPLGP
ncbi:MAG: hypothetical protein P4L69_24120 [Desulfosporosinus sp.]|nr:hypothetical protein [Desulfosporosinus sp.]